MQAWTLTACFAVLFLKCLILTVSVLAFAGNQMLRAEPAHVLTKVAAPEAERTTQLQVRPAR